MKKVLHRNIGKLSLKITLLVQIAPIILLRLEVFQSFLLRQKSLLLILQKMPLQLFRRESMAGMQNIDWQC